MPGLLVGIILIASLLLVHFSLRKHPMPESRPLDVDEGLPLPEIGQASTVFSLTALFGAYFGIALLLGLPALTGVAFGTGLGLFLIRYWIDKYKPKRFENFLLKILNGASGNIAVYAMVISGVQCLYATSELLILREIAKVSFGVRPEQATFLAVGIGIIGYFYVLFGGYVAVFRTDILQFVLVGIMAITFGVYSLGPALSSAGTTGLFPRAGYWEAWAIGSGFPLYIYHFIIGTIMGMGLLVGSPDTWKRVFLVRRRKKKRRIRFVFLVIVGMVPCLTVLPFAIIIGPVPDGEINSGLMFSKLLTNDALYIAAVTGLIASFLSAFNSAILASVHIGLILKRRKSPVETETTRFHWLMVTVITSLFMLFIALTNVNNPYLLGHLLLGAYSIIAGVQIGSRGNISRLPENSLLWIYIIGFVGWFLYLASTINFPKVPTTYQINSVPGGVLFCLITALICQILSIGGKKNARRH
jgi:hypothetical protein